MIAATHDALDQAFEALERETPDPLTRLICRLRQPRARWVRIPLGLFFILCACFWFLPVVGVEFAPIGLLLIAQDVPFLREPVGRMMLWLLHRWIRLRQRFQGKPWERAMQEKAILAGGCFWGMQDLIRKLPGVISTRVGYTGGDVPNATYRNHGTHAEAIEIIFDPRRLSYRRLLEFFFQIHDPTTKNRQGNDRGTSYRSAIFYVDERQREIAEDTIDEVNASRRWPGKVVTEVEPAGPFWEAEPEHQDYLERYPDGYTCHYVRPEWVLPASAQVPTQMQTETSAVSGSAGPAAGPGSSP